VKGRNKMKLEAGMYVRTPFGIRKIKNIKKDNGYGKPRVKVIELDRILDTIFKFDYEFYTDEKVIKECKASHNIIDLIEVGDYVNGYRVDYIENINANNNFILQRIFCEEYEKDLYSKSFKPSDIKSIVTKEQFSSMEYKVGD
jgi:hypothetical protein